MGVDKVVNFIAAHEKINAEMQMRKGIQFHNQIALQLAPSVTSDRLPSPQRLQGENGGRGEAGREKGICVEVDWLNLFIVGSNFTFSCSKVQ